MTETVEPAEAGDPDILRRWAQQWDRARVALDAVARADGLPGPRELDELLEIDRLLPRLERGSGLVEQQRLLRTSRP